MSATRLQPTPHQRVWGRDLLPCGFEDVRAGDGPIGEIWFGDGKPDALLVKYLFTSERLSIQVHPDDAAARARGHAHGKDEAWLVLDAEPGAVIGLGLRREASAAELRAAALDGSIEELVDWRAVKAGDAFFSPAGTIHAIGAGLSLIEIQQNIDLTYRLYDYGRPRALHLDDAVAVARPGPWALPPPSPEPGPGRRLLAGGESFTLERWTLAGTAEIELGGTLLIVPLGNGATLDGEALGPGSVWRVEGKAQLENVDALAAWPAGIAPAVRASS